MLITLRGSCWRHCCQNSRNRQALSPLRGNVVHGINYNESLLKFLSFVSTGRRKKRALIWRKDKQTLIKHVCCLYTILILELVVIFIIVFQIISLISETICCRRTHLISAVFLGYYYHYYCSKSQFNVLKSYNLWLNAHWYPCGYFGNLAECKTVFVCGWKIIKKIYIQFSRPHWRTGAHFLCSLSFQSELMLTYMGDDPKSILGKSSYFEIRSSGQNVKKGKIGKLSHLNLYL